MYLMLYFSVIILVISSNRIDISLFKFPLSQRYKCTLNGHSSHFEYTLETTTPRYLEMFTICSKATFYSQLYFSSRHLSLQFYIIQHNFSIRNSLK